MHNGSNASIPTFIPTDEIYSTIDFTFISDQMCPILRFPIYTDYTLHGLTINCSFFQLALAERPLSLATGMPTPFWLNRKRIGFN